MEFNENSIFANNNKNNKNFEMDPSVYSENNINNKTFNFSKLNKNLDVSNINLNANINNNSYKVNNTEKIKDSDLYIKVDRLNFLYFQSKSPTGLTQSELEEQGLLREYFIKYFKQNVKY